MRVLGAALALLVSAGAAFGNTDAIEERCRDNGLAAKKRVAACTRLIEDATYESKAWALARRGDALGDGGDHAPAVEDLNASLELEPDWAQALRWRAGPISFLTISRLQRRILPMQPSWSQTISGATISTGVRYTG